VNRTVLILLRKELLELRADRKAVILGVFLPVFLYPLLFFFTSTLEKRHERQQQDLPSRVVLLDAARRFAPSLEQDGRFELVSLGGGDDADAALAQGRVDAVLFEAGADSMAAAAGADSMATAAGVDSMAAAAGADSMATAAAEGHGTFEAARSPSPPHYLIRYRRTLERSQLALQRLRAHLEKVRAEQRQEAYRRHGGTGVLDSLEVLEEVDVATAEEAGGARAGRRLVYLLLMTLFVSGATLANDLVAGEKERGTIETLYLLPVPRRDIAVAKTLVVVGGTTISGVLSLVSISACYAAGWIDSPGALAGTISPLLLAAAVLLVVPLALFLGGLLLGISTFARSLKESQQLVLPAMIICFGAGILSMSQAVRLDSAVALVPVANVALAIRDLLAGQIRPLSIVLVSGSSLLWSALLLYGVTRQLQREEMVLGFDPEPLFAPTRAGRRRAILLALSLSVLAYFYLGSLLQSRWNTRGVLISLWGLLPLLGALSLWFVGTGNRSLRELLSLRAAPSRALAAAVLLAWGLMLPMMGGWMRLQAHFLPAPESMGEDLQALFTGLPTWKIFVLGALSPAICEELLFRGVFLGLLRRYGSERAAVLTTAVFFGLIHLSIFRFVPTAVLGVLLALLVVRSASILPAMLFHLSYNGTLLLGQLLLEDHPLPFAVDGALAWALSLVLLATGAVLLRSIPVSSPSTPHRTP